MNIRMKYWQRSHYRREYIVYIDEISHALITFWNFSKVVTIDCTLAKPQNEREKMIEKIIKTEMPAALEKMQRQTVKHAYRLLKKSLTQSIRERGQQ